MDLAAFVAGLEAYGYAGVFAANLIGSAATILPVPAFAVTVAAAGALNPFLVGIVAGVGAAIGALVAYLLGLGGKKIVEGKKDRQQKLGEWKKKLEGHKAFWWIIIFAATPIPDAVIGFFCGLVKYDWKKYLLAQAIGKITLNLAIAYAGFYGIKFAFEFFGI